MSILNLLVCPRSHGCTYERISRRSNVCLETSSSLEAHCALFRSPEIRKMITIVPHTVNNCSISDKKKPQAAKDTPKTITIVPHTVNNCSISAK